MRAAFPSRTPFRLAITLYLALAALFPGPSPQAQTNQPGTDEGRPFPEPPPPAADAQAGLAYVVAIEGVAEDDLAEKLRTVSQLVALRDEPPRSLSGLLRRASRDRERLMEVLHSEGFYAARIGTDIDPGASPTAVTIAVETGPVFVLGEYEIIYEPPPKGGELPDEPENIGLTIGMHARAEPIDQARRDLVGRLREIGRPLARITDHRVVVDHARQTMRVTVKVAPGPAAHFGPLAVEGLETVSEGYVRRLVPWREGETWDRRKVEEYRRALTETELFEGVAIEHAASTDPSGRLPVTAKLREAKHRSIGAGTRYSTDIGPSVSAFWQHRNLMGANETVSLETEIGLIEQSLAADFVKPHFRRLDQDLLLNATVRRQEHDAFDEKSVALFAGLERSFGDWRARGGPSFDYSVLDDDTGEQTFALVGLPLSLSHDGTDDLLDPARGTRTSFSATPYQGIDESVTFLALETSGSAYLSLDEDDRFVFATRGRIGSLVGEATREIPANKRFYAGGGGSVRGYSYRSLGPLSAENDPLGGRSVVELGMEMRARITEEIGIVPFLEGGTVYDDDTPGSIADLRWAAGLGARYYTAIGPIRFDVAVPLDRRAGVDDSFEIYGSIGQAF